MSRIWEPRKSTVELQPSRIRREPVSDGKPLTLVKPEAPSREWEIGIAIVGMIMFAIAINALWLGLNTFIFN